MLKIEKHIFSSYSGKFVFTFAAENLNILLDFLYFLAQKLNHSVFRGKRHVLRKLFLMSNNDFIINFPGFSFTSQKQKGVGVGVSDK